jgi:hypothetical protein
MPAGGGPRNVNPVIGLKKRTKETTRDRVLTDDEIHRLVGDVYDAEPVRLLMVALRHVTAHRGGE